MKGSWIWIIITVILIVGGAGGWFWYSMQQPLYRPGMVRAGKNLRAALTPPAQTGNEQFWQVEEDIQLHHFAVGHAEGRNVLIVHGGPGMPYTEAWQGLSPLTDAYRFHYYDQRGAGQSTRPFERFASRNYYQNMTTLEQTLGIGAHLADIERIRQLLGEEKLLLIGHSWGAFLTTLYAAEFPERVEAMILVSPADMLVMPQKQDDLFATVRKRLPVEMHDEYDAYMKAYLDFGGIFTKTETELQAANRQFGTYYQLATEQSALSGGEAGGWMVHAMYFSIGRRHDYRAALQSITAPVLILHGADDLQSEAVSQGYVDALTNAQLAVIPNAGHIAFDEQPAAFAQQVQQFLSPWSND